MAIDSPTRVSADTTTPLTETPMSLAEHRRVFSPAAAPVAAEAAASEPASETPASETRLVEPDTATQPGTSDDADRARDEQGRFQKGASRGRAAKDVATPADVPRIRELSKKVRDLQTENETLKQAAMRPAAGDQPATSDQPAAAPARAPEIGPKPTPDAFDTYEAYLDARDAYNRAQWTAEERTRQETARITDSWKTRVEAAINAHPDFEEVALQAPTKIPGGSLMDAWILESTAGALILYALQKDEPERQRIAALPPVQQAEALALLGQRLTASPADPTGATRTPPLPAVPRPPTPVRTAPMRTGDELPGDDASLSEHRKAWGPRATRR